MNKKELEKAHQAGECDELTEAYLIDSARLYIDSEVSQVLTAEEDNELVEAYFNGFMGNKL